MYITREKLNLNMNNQHVSIISITYLTSEYVQYKIKGKGRNEVTFQQIYPSFSHSYAQI